jgi:hypothetical protein
MSMAGLRRFLQDTFSPRAEQQPPPQQVTPEQTAAALADQRAADDVIDIFAWEALVALQKYAEHLGEDHPDTPAKVGDLLVRTWDDAGLDLAEWPEESELSDAQALLRTAVDSAVRFPGVGGTVRGAVDDLATVQQRFPARTVGEVASELERAYGRPLVTSSPAHWLRSSLGRVAAARLVRDTVGLEARAEAGPEAREWAQRILRESEMHGYDRDQGVDRAEQHERQVAGTWKGKVATLAAAVAGVAGLDYAVTGDVDQWLSGGAVVVYVASRLALNYRDQRRDASRGVGTAQEQNRSGRSDLGGSLDRFGERHRPPPAPGARDRHGDGIGQR